MFQFNKSQKKKKKSASLQFQRINRMLETCSTKGKIHMNLGFGQVEVRPTTYQDIRPPSVST